MPMRGLVNITYYSGEGVRKKGCRPYVNFRKALLNLVRDCRSDWCCDRCATMNGRRLVFSLYMSVCVPCLTLLLSVPRCVLQVLLREEEVVSEDMRSKPPPAVQPGDRAFQKHLSKHHCCTHLVRVGIL
jgi:hypothetical protein